MRNKRLALFEMKHFRVLLVLCTLLSFFPDFSFAQSEKPVIGIKDFKNYVELYHNLSSDILDIKISNYDLNNLELRFTNLIGNEIKVDFEELSIDKANRTKYFRVPTSKFDPGYYFLILKDSETRFQEAIRFEKKNVKKEN